MVENSLQEIKRRWDLLTTHLSVQFGEKPDLQTVLFLVGVQELGAGYKKYSKNEKQDLMHIAVCRILSVYGFYRLEGLDEDGWPHWLPDQKMPHLTLAQQDQLLKQGVIQYFEESGMPI